MSSRLDPLCTHSLIVAVPLPHLALPSPSAIDTSVLLLYGALPHCTMKSEALLLHPSLTVAALVEVGETGLMLQIFASTRFLTAECRLCS
ncbi:unnamed protein product [Arabis nemorensis]|uniref:Uncharacterized protein n=1 Tax=Arabis nemorensis TaxID=586526 RepID=A0A565AXX4_9BRAS|nr:unnamed protein product [Arabis nemorensis]